MKLKNETSRLQTISRLYFTRVELINALVAFAESKGQHFDVLASELVMILPANYASCREEEPIELRIARQGEKAGIW